MRFDIILPAFTVVILLTASFAALTGENTGGDEEFVFYSADPFADVTDMTGATATAPPIPEVPALTNTEVPDATAYSVNDTGTAATTSENTMAAADTGTETVAASAAEKIYKYVITGSGNSFTATGYNDDDTTYTLGPNTILNLFSAIRTDAGGNACTIVFGSDGSILDIGANRIEFSNVAGNAWGVVTLEGALTSAHATNQSGIIFLTGGAINNVSIISRADITATSGSAVSVIRNNGTGSVTVMGGTLQQTQDAPGNHAINNNSSGTITVRDGIIQSTGGVAIQNINSPPATINIFGGTLSSLNNDNAIVNTNAGSWIFLGGDPIINGNINVSSMGRLSAITSGADMFAPSDDQTYYVTLAGTLALAGTVAVANGANHIDKFTLTNDGWGIRVNGNNVFAALERTITFNLNGGTGEPPPNMIVVSGTTAPSAPETGEWTFDGWHHDGWYIPISTDGTMFSYTPFIFGGAGVGTVVDRDRTLHLVWTQYEYRITGGLTSTTVVKVFENGTTNIIENVAIDRAIDAIRTDAQGNACTITFVGNMTSILNIGTANIEFNNTDDLWGTVTLGGTLVSAHAENNSAVILMSGDMNIISRANITGTGTNLTSGVIRNNGTGSIDVTGGMIHQNHALGGSAIYNNGTGTITVSGGIIQSNNEIAINNRDTATVNIFGGTVGSIDGNVHAISSTNPDSSVILGGDPTIIGNINVSYGVLGVLTSGDNAFAPTNAEPYRIFLPILFPDLAVVVDGGSFAGNFVTNHTTWSLEARGDDLVFARNLAHWHIVTFDTNDGKTPTNDFVPIYPISKAASWNPVRPMYTFTGWFHDDVKWDFDQYVTENMILIAQWTHDPLAGFTVTFNPNNGENTWTESVQMFPSSPVPRPADPLFESFIFAEWFHDDVLWNFDDYVTENIRLIAKWSHDPSYWYTVTFNPNIPMGETWNEFILISSPSPVDKPPVDPERDGLVFSGWFFEGVKWEFTNNVEGNMQLVVRWSYTVIFNPDNGEVLPNALAFMNPASTVAKPSPDPTKATYRFEGWFHGDDEWIFTEYVTQNMTLTAKWSIMTTLPNNWTVSFDPDNGVAAWTVNVPMSPASPVEKPVDPVRFAYFFDGWFFGNEEWIFANIVEDNMTLKAKWSQNPLYWFTITYNLNEGTGTAPVDNTKRTAGTMFNAASSSGMTAPEGLVFKEWNTQADGEGLSFVAGATITKPNGNMVLFAIWGEPADDEMNMLLILLIIAIIAIIGVVAYLRSRKK